MPPELPEFKPSAFVEGLHHEAGGHVCDACAKGTFLSWHRWYLLAKLPSEAFPYHLSIGCRTLLLLEWMQCVSATCSPRTNPSEKRRAKTGRDC